MKKCPFCAEEIQDEAIKCKHCGEFPDTAHPPRIPDEKTQWYFKKSFIIFAFCCVGPLALPLIWQHPHLTLAWKIGLTISILILSWFLLQSTLESIHILKEYYQMMKEM